MARGVALEGVGDGGVARGRRCGLGGVEDGAHGAAGGVGDGARRRCSGRRRGQRAARREATGTAALLGEASARGTRLGWRPRGRRRWPTATIGGVFCVGGLRLERKFAKCEWGRRRGAARAFIPPPFSPGWWLQPGLKGVFSPG
jgi:hypothetical protein